EAEGYRHGLLQLNQILSIVPGAGSVFRELTGLGDSDLRSVDILTEFQNSSHGLGTTVIADLYLDFSLYGVILFLFFFGYFLRILDIKVSGNSYVSLLSWVCFLIFFGKGIYIGRSSIVVIFRDVALVFIFL